MLLCLLLVVLPSPPASSSLSGMLLLLLLLVLLLLLFLFWLLGVIMLFILISILDIDQATSSLKESAVTSGHGMTRQIDQEKGLAMKKWHEMTYVTPIDIINNCWRTSLSLINPTSSFCQKKKCFPLSLSKGSKQHVEKPFATCREPLSISITWNLGESKELTFTVGAIKSVSRQNSPEFHHRFT